LIVCGTNGLGKTLIAKNIAHVAVLAGHSVLFRTAADLLADLDGDSPGLRRRKFRFYARPALLVIDECGYLAYDAHAADLLFEVINHRYERNSILLTTNKAFKDWNTVFPNATCIAALLDRLTRHADVTLIEGTSYRVRESELEAVDPSFWIFGGKPMQQGILGDTLLHTLQQAAQGSTDGATLRLALRGSLLYPRYLQLVSDCRLRLIPYEVFVAQPCAGIRVMAQFQVKHHKSPVLIRATAFGHGPAD
jgi:hypothetical protein